MAIQRASYNTDSTLIGHVSTYMRDRGMPFAMRAGRVVPVGLVSGRYSKRNFGDLIDSDTFQRVGADGRLTQSRATPPVPASYACEEWGDEELVRYRDRQQGIAIGDDPGRWAMQRLAGGAMANLNNRFAQVAMTAASWGGNTAAAENMWTGGEDPFEEIYAIVRNLQLRGVGADPIHMLFGVKAYDAFITNAMVVDRYKHTTFRGPLTTDGVAMLCGVQSVSVANQPHAAGADAAPAWHGPNDVLFTAMGPASTRESRAAVLVFEFRHQGVKPIGAGMNVKSRNSESREGIVYSCRTDFDIQIADQNRGYLLTAVSA